MERKWKWMDTVTKQYVVYDVPQLRNYNIVNRIYWRIPYSHIMCFSHIMALFIHGKLILFFLNSFILAWHFFCLVIQHTFKIRLVQNQKDKAQCESLVHHNTKKKLHFFFSIEAIMEPKEVQSRSQSAKTRWQ